MNYSPITFNTLPTIYKNQKLNPNDFELIQNHNYVMYFDASDYYISKHDSKIYRISFQFNKIYHGPHQVKS
jgi:hypothetical protein